MTKTLVTRAATQVRGDREMESVLDTALLITADVACASEARLVETTDGEEVTNGAPLGVDSLSLVLAGARPRELGLLDLCARFVRQAWVWTQVATGSKSAGGRIRRKSFLNWLGDKVTSARDQGQQLALLLLDLEDHGPFAQLYGSAEMEEKVPLLYNAIERAVRGVDSVYRCDDTSLAVVLPRCDRANAIKVAMRIRAALVEANAAERRTSSLQARLRIYTYPDELTVFATGIREEDVASGDPLANLKLWAGFLAGSLRGEAVVFGADDHGTLRPVYTLAAETPREVPRQAEESFRSVTAVSVPRAAAGERASLYVPASDSKGPTGVLQVESIHGSFGAAEAELGKRAALRLGALLRHMAPEAAPGAGSPAGSPAARSYQYNYDGIIGKSAAMSAVFELLERVVETDYPVIIQGESGTGKELIARAIHFNGRRREKPLIAENCAALNENLLEAELFGYEKGAFTGAESSRKGLFELADGGTLFLDEVADMGTGMQKDLLRILQEGIVRPVGGKKFVKIDVRVLCASNRDLANLVEEGKFRSDLYYRLNVWSIHMPALRDRREDIPLLVDHLLQKIAQQTGTPSKTLGRGVSEALQSYDWPGNIRDLKNEIARMVAMSTGDEILLRDFSKKTTVEVPRAAVDRAGDDVQTLDEIERLHILKVLRFTNGNRARAAELLGINKATIYRKLKQYGLEA